MKTEHLKLSVTDVAGRLTNIAGGVVFNYQRFCEY